jgi:hypothetical protein
LDRLENGNETRCELVSRPRQCCSAAAAGLIKIVGISQARSSRLLCSQRGLGAVGYQSALLFGQRSIKMQHKGIGIAAQLGDDEWHPLSHQTGHEGDIARQPIELGYDDAAYRRGTTFADERRKRCQRQRNL